MRSVPSRLRLASQAAAVPRFEAFSGSTLLTRNTSSRRPAMASPTSDSERPLPYISAVSMSVRPWSSPRRNAASSAARCSRRSPMFQVPCPSAGTRSPEGSAMVFIRTV